MRAITAKNRPSSAANDLKGLELGLDAVHLSLIRSFTSYRRNACNTSPTKTQCMSLFSLFSLRIVLGERLRDDGSQGADAGFRAVEWYGDPDTADRVGDPSHKTGAWRQEKRRLPITRPRRNKNSQHLLIRDFHLLPCKICTLCPGKTFFNSNLYRLIESLIYLESIVSLLPSF